MQSKRTIKSLLIKHCGISEVPVGHEGVISGIVESRMRSARRKERAVESGNDVSSHEKTGTTSVTWFPKCQVLVAKQRMRDEADAKYVTT